MNKQTEALKMAIKQMNVYAFKHLCDYQIEDKELLEAIQACKEALKLSEKQHTISDKEQPAQGIELEWYQKGWDDAKREVTQEPVAWLWLEHGKPRNAFLHEPMQYNDDGYWTKKGFSYKPLYTHPAPSWQGLSDDEIEAVTGEDIRSMYSGTYDSYRAIEQDLKEKNT